MPYRIRILKAAANDLANIKEYLLRRTKSDATATHVVLNILAKIDGLALFPASHAICEFRADLRKMVVGTYVVFYRIDETRKTVEVGYIIHSARNIARILYSDDRSPEPYYEDDD